MTRISFKAIIAFVLFPALLVLNTHAESSNAQPEQLVKDIYPGAQCWFEALSKKYPEAQLSNVSFYVSSYCHSGKQAIYWQEDRLQKINVAYSSKTNQNSLSQLFKQDEYILLHEAGHILKNHNTKAYVALAMAALAFAAVNGYITLRAMTNPACTFFKWSKLSMTAIFANSTIFSSLFFYIQSQEKEADAFANTYADEQALLAGNDYFDLCIAHDQKLADFVEMLVFTHPSLKSRKQEIAKAVASRFVENNQAA